MCVCVYACMYERTYVCTYMCMFIYVYMCLQIRKAMYDANMRNYSSHYDRKYGVHFHYWDYVGKYTMRQLRKVCSFHTEVTVGKTFK